MRMRSTFRVREFASAVASRDYGARGARDDLAFWQATLRQSATRSHNRSREFCVEGA